MKLSIFKNVMAKMPLETELDMIVKVMRTSEKTRLLCDQTYQLLEEGKKTEADEIKKKLLPAFAPSALMYDGKGRANVTGLTDLCFLDIDHITDDQIAATMELLRIDPHVVLAIRSISRYGLHIIVRYRLNGIEHPWIGNMGTNRMNHTYGSVFKTMRKHYQEKLQLSIDK